MTLPNDPHAWTDRNSLTGIDRQWVHKKDKVCFRKIHLKCIKMANVAIINDNNNFVLSIFQSLCEFVGDCFGPRYFSSGSTLLQKKKYLGPEQSPPISHNDLNKDGAQLLLSNQSSSITMHNPPWFSVDDDFPTIDNAVYARLRSRPIYWNHDLMVGVYFGQIVTVTKTKTLIIQSS